jgi:hypothetical protein
MITCILNIKGPRLVQVQELPDIGHLRSEQSRRSLDPINDPEESPNTTGQGAP